MFFLAIGCAMGCGAGGGKGRGLGIPKCGKGHEPCSKNPKGHARLVSSPQFVQILDASRVRIPEAVKRYIVTLIHEENLLKKYLTKKIK